MALVAGLIVVSWQVHVARVERARAQRRFNDVRKLANSLLFDIHDAIRDLPGSSPVRGQILQKAVEYLDSLSAEADKEPALLGELATAYERVGDLEGHAFTNLGNTATGLTSYQKALRIREQLAAVPSAGSQEQLALASCYRRVAYQLLSIGDTRAASEHIAKAVAIAEGISKREPDSSKLLYELGYDYEIAGHIQGGNWSAVDLGDIRAALNNYQKAVAVDETLVKNDSAGDGNKAALAIDLGFEGEASLKLGDDEKALQVEQRGVRLVQELLAKSKTARQQRNLGSLYDNIAAVFEARGDFTEALEYRQELVGLYTELSAADPKNILMKQDLGSTYVDLGRILARKGRIAEGLRSMGKGIAINEQVAAVNPSNAEQRGILAQFYVNRAEVLSSANQNSAAIKDYERARAIYRDLRTAAPTNLHALLSETACDAALGGVYLRDGNSAKAEKLLHNALDMVTGPATASPEPNPQALYTLAEVSARLGDLSARSSRWSDAQQWYAKSLETWKRIQHPAKITPYVFRSDDPKHAASGLKQCAAHLS